MYSQAHTLVVVQQSVRSFVCESWRYNFFSHTALDYTSCSGDGAHNGYKACKEVGALAYAGITETAVSITVGKRFCFEHSGDINCYTYRELNLFYQQEEIGTLVMKHVIMLVKIISELLVLILV